MQSRIDQGGSRRNRLICLAALAPLLWFFAVMAWGGVYSFPQTDDFCTFGRVFTRDAYNPLADAWHMYLMWTGRYSSVFMVASTGWLSSVTPWPLYATYQLVVVGLVVALIAGCIAAMNVLSMPRLVNVSVGSIAAAAALTFMPSRLEGVYWLTGAAIYVTSVAVLLATAWSIVRDDRAAAGRAAVRWPYASMAWIVFCVGFNELIALSLGGFLLLRVAFFARGGSYRKRNIAYGVAYAISMLVTVCAPGNFARDALSQVPRHEVGGAATLALHSLELFIDSRMSPNAGILLGVLVGVAVFTWAVRPPAFARFNRIAPLALTLLVAMPAHLYVYSFLTGEETPGRIINQCYAMTLVGACLLAAWSGAAVAERTRRKPALLVACAVLACTGAAFLTTAQFRQVVDTARDFGPVWHAQQLQRLDALRAGRGNSISLPPFSPEGHAWPLFQGADITEDPAYWVNSCLGNMHGIREIRLQGSNGD